MATSDRVRTLLGRRTTVSGERPRARLAGAGLDTVDAPERRTIRVVSAVGLLTITLVVLLAVVAIARFWNLERGAAETAETTIPSVLLVEHIRSEALEHRGLLLAHFLTANADAMFRLETGMAAMEADIREELGQFDALSDDSEDVGHQRETDARLVAYFEAAAEAVAISRTMSAGGSSAGLEADVDPAFDALMAELRTWAEDEAGEAEGVAAAVRDSIGGDVLLIGLVLAATVILIIAATFLAERSVARASAVSAGLLQSALVLNRFTELSSISDDDDELGRLSLNSIAALAGSETGVLHLSNASTDRAQPLATVGGPPEVSLTLGELGRCPGVRGGSVHLTEDVAGPLSIRCPAYPAEQGSLLCVPLSAHGQAIGAIHLHWPGPARLDPVASAAVVRAANQAALTMANRQLVLALRGMAATDPKTQLSNARSFDEALRDTLRRWQDGDRLAVLMLDIDHFKDFNDRHGHPAGDEALRTVAGIIRSCLRDGDRAARYGGEEFAVLLPRVDAAGALAVAERIRARAAATFIQVGPGITDRLTISIGLATAPTDGLDRMGLMRASDAALYTAKQRGRNRVVTTSGVDEPSQAALGEVVA